MRLIWHCLSALSICLLTTAEDIKGRVLRVPKDAYEAGLAPKSWWLAHTDEATDEWKRKRLDLSNTQLHLFRVVLNQPLADEQKIPVTSAGDFTIPELSEGEYLLQPVHVAYKFNPVLISVVGDHASFFRLDAHTGTKNILGKMSSLTLRPERFDAPYPTPGGIDVLKYLKNPMVLMLLGTAFVGIVLPRLMDPDAMAELQQEQAADRPEFSSAFFSKVKSITN
eukprot:Blabericola_migrator_1__12400@NODE_77_length_15155_cov_63_173383_g69_i0_p7_GENE_NODE_77_length_15155_cov_63_173383_g69_i0NODE_77_length_15155_cov_63_173383_g69_i0_p7_ORF_typecomplete_len224_score42_90DUF2012/PF09430_10/2_1e11_NODE_77_length_15155_cov_63_173383_g69_i064687139